MIAGREGPPPVVLVMGEEGDLHALAAQRTLRQLGDVECHVVATDRLYGAGGLAWSSDTDEGNPATLPTVDGNVVDVSRVDVVWFRRLFGKQEFGGDRLPADHQDVINAQFPSATLGILLTSFDGRWISDPAATRMAENKQLQIQVARRAGLATPRTLVSTDPVAVRRFCARLGAPAVVKSLRQSASEVMMTQLVRPEHLASDETLRMCPAIYQELVPGQQHLRVHLFGDYVGSMLIESADLDWRQDLSVPCRPYDLDEKVVGRLRQVLAALDLRMGVFDLKLAGAEVVWLELNPQGQFLFAEGLCGLPLMAEMAGFLRSEALAAARRRRAVEI